MVSDKTLTVLLVLAIISSIGATIITLINIEDLREIGLGGIRGLTGKATDTGTASVEITGAAGITLTDETIDFGAGYVWANASLAILDSSDSSVVNGSWTGVTDAMTITNSGTQAINVTVSMASADAEVFLCGTGDCPNTATAKVEVKAADNEANSCITGLQSTYTDLGTASTKITVLLCSNLAYADSNDAIDMNVRIKIPYDADSGAKQETLTFTGMAI